MRRSLLPLPLVLVSALALAGCAADDGGPADPTSGPVADVEVCDAPTGDAATSIEVGGDFGSEPTVAFEAPLAVDETERSFVIEGDEVAPGALVSAAYALYNGTTGDLLETYGWGAEEPLTPFRGDYALLGPGFAKTLGCAGVGTRTVGVIPAVEGFGAQGEQIGLGADDVLVFVVDVLGDNIWSTDLPVVGGTDEAPTVTLPSAAPKTELEIAVLDEGDGAVVSPTDTVSVHYLGTAWETGEVFDESYPRGEPSTFPVQGVVQGFSQALIGQKVGSRVIVTMPPLLGYGAQEGHALQHSTLVFLIDIVDVVSG